ncbi:DUF4179 domain-containing protein [Paenibacillus sp. GbtcB18]|uniref:DUF4179 domain-containing protein n=1 Tax=Paenibacillus sp. GbtcB18 TaxID=2824763 RepID=UPI001C30EF72|nr:DUF4179 domain-containing protein [Paenibacillus sp. GbtcB18]
MSIPENIKEALKDQIENAEVPQEVDRRVRQSFLEFHKKKESKPMKKRLVAFSIAAAILIPTSVFASLGGTSYFFKESANINGLVNEGTKRALSDGLSVPMNEKITDHGLTVQFSEVYVEDSKVLVHYKITGEDGKLVPYEFDTRGLNVINDGKKNGKQVENPTYQEKGLEGFSVLSFIGTSKKERLPFTLTDAAGNEIDTGIAEKDQPEGVLAFVTNGAKLPESIRLNVNIDRIGATKGSWKAQFTIDQSKAKQASEKAH